MNSDILDKVSKNDDIIMGADGFYCFWPTNNNGSYSEYDLRLIANELEKKNSRYREEFCQYFLNFGEENGC